jgi:hypothetical protein
MMSIANLYYRLANNRNQGWSDKFFCQPEKFSYKEIPNNLEIGERLRKAPLLCP